MSRRILELSQPRKLNVMCLPDKPSVYWYDYIPDPTPHLITDPEQLLQYYETHWFKKYPRAVTMAFPRTPRSVSETEVSRPITQFGTPLSALRYTPSERIKELAEPREGDPNCDEELNLQLINFRPSRLGRGDRWDWSKLPKTPMQRAMGSKVNLKPSDTMMSHGDFRSRSRIRKCRVPSALKNEKLTSPGAIRLPRLNNNEEERVASPAKS